MEENTGVLVITEDTLQDKIYNIRGQKVMLDFELAEIYGYTTARFNEQVKNNMEKFDNDFMFQLSKEEFKNLMSKKSTSSWGGRRKLPKAFTEQGIYMLMTVLRGELAVKQSKALVRTFKKMKDYIIDNRELIGQREYIRLSMQMAENVRDIYKLKSDIGTVEKNKLHCVEYEDFCRGYPEINITLKKTGGIYHDRFIVLDYGTDNERVFLCGASSKDAGARITSIVEDYGVKKYKALIDDLLKNQELILT